MAAVTERELVNSELSHFLNNRTNDGGSNVLAWGELTFNPTATHDHQRLLSHEAIRAAFRLLQARHPHLQCRIRWDARRKRGVFVKSPELPDLALLDFDIAGADPVSVVDGQSTTRRMLNKLLQLKFGDDCAHMGIGVYKNNSKRDDSVSHAATLPTADNSYIVAVVVGHAVGDLISITVLLNELVYFLSVATKQTSIEDARARLPARSDFPAPCPQLIPRNRRGFCRFLFGGGMGVVKALKGSERLNHAVAFDATTAAERQASGFEGPITLSFTKDETLALVAACKSNGVSVHSALVIALHFAHRYYWSQDKAHADRVAAVARAHHNAVPVPMITTVDQRRRATPPVPPSVVGALAYSVVTKVPVPVLRTSDQAIREDFWATTRTLYAQLQTKLERTEHWWIGYLFDMLIPRCLLLRMLDSFQDKVPVPLALGNVGVVEPLECPGFTLNSMNVEFNNSTSGVYVCAVTFRGQLSLSCHSLRLPSRTQGDIMTFMQHVLKLVSMSNWTVDV